MQRRFMVLISTLALMIVASPGWAQSQLYQFYRSELSRTADGPTVSRSVWAGRFLPAAWK